MNAPDDPTPDDVPADDRSADATAAQTDDLDDASADHDPVLEAAGARLRDDARPLSATAIELAVLRRRTRRLSATLGAAALVIAVGAATFAVTRSDGGTKSTDLAHDVRPQTPGQREQVENLVLSLSKKQPVDPRKVKLVSSVKTFGDCNGLIGDLRRVGAEHVGSQGFGTYGYGFYPYGRDRLLSAYAADGGVKASASAQRAPNYAPNATGAGGETLGTNVQVVGVDELDSVKTEGKFIYDLDGKGNLRITDAQVLEVRSTLDVTPKPMAPSGDGKHGHPPRQDPTNVSQLLVTNGHVVIFGSETEVSKPVPGDPSATQAMTGYMTVTFVDATDVLHPKVTDRVRIEGGLVSARMVDGEVRLVTTSNMADLGFVMPTTPTSVAKALEQNRRSVASSTAADWIPDWQRVDESPQPLVPCDRVHVPDTFSGVAMTSMVTFPMTTGRFDPIGTSILAPGDTLYAGLDKVAISSEVWVDPIDRDRLKFDHWQTAIHEFEFAQGEAPAYEGSGIVDGSTIGQFAFGEIGPSLAVVTTKGTPWSQDTKKRGVDLTVLTPDGDGHLDVASKIEDLSGGKGQVVAVRFVEGRVLVSTGLFGRQVVVIDVTDPAHPRRAGAITVQGNVGYFHPLPDGQALMIASRTDTVGTGKHKVMRSWVLAHLLDVSNADDPKVLSTWERPWSSDDVSSDHHAFTYWPNRKLAMWGISDTQPSNADRPNHAAVLGIDGTVTEVAVPVANRPNEVPPPCPSVPIPADAEDMVGPRGVLLRCDDGTIRSIEWPRYECYRVGKGAVEAFAPDQTDKAFFVCSLMPMPRVARVLVVSGRPILYTDQTLEALDPQTFASTQIAYHLNRGTAIAY